MAVDTDDLFCGNIREFDTYDEFEEDDEIHDLDNNEELDNEASD